MSDGTFWGPIGPPSADPATWAAHYDAWAAWRFQDWCGRWWHEVPSARMVEIWHEAAAFRETPSLGWCAEMRRRAALRGDSKGFH